MFVVDNEEKAWSSQRTVQSMFLGGRCRAQVQAGRGYVSAEESAPRVNSSS